MQSEDTVFNYTAVLERFDQGISLGSIEFPYNVLEIFGTKGFVRMVGKLNNHPVERALFPDGKGGHFIVVSKDIMRKAGITLGAKVQVQLQKKQFPDEIIMPEEMIEALTLDPKAHEKFEALTPGVKRGIAYWLNSGKRVETRIQRAAEVLRRLQDENFHFGGKKIKTQNDG